MIATRANLEAAKPKGFNVWSVQAISAGVPINRLPGR